MKYDEVILDTPLDKLIQHLELRNSIFNKHTYKPISMIRLKGEDKYCWRYLVKVFYGDQSIINIGLSSTTEDDTTWRKVDEEVYMLVFINSMFGDRNLIKGYDTEG